MTDAILNSLSQGRCRSVAALARELDTSEEMLEALLSHLESLGYVRKVTLAADGRSARCGSCHACARGEEGRRPFVYWELCTESEDEKR